MAVPMEERSVRDHARLLSLVIAALFFALTTGVSYLRWAHFQYRTFDLAYYVQALWQLVHGRFEVSVQGVPLLGNHVEPIATRTAGGRNRPSGSTLLSMTREPEIFPGAGELVIKMRWRFEEPREYFPWLELALSRTGDHRRFVMTKGVCAPEAPVGLYDETWTVAFAPGLPAGEYSCEAYFYDNAKRAWSERMGRAAPPPSPLVAPVPLGQIKIVEPQTRP